MKLDYLWISKYKNLEDIKFLFKADLVTLLVGQNGLGKSNLLEAIIIIFSNLDLAEDEEEFTVKPFRDFFEFRISYTCKEYNVRVKAQDDKLQLSVKNLKESEDKFKKISFLEFKRRRTELIPDYIIGYYSGENPRIENFFSRHRQLRIGNLKRRESKENFPALGRMFFTDEHCAHLILFILWIYKDSEQLGTQISNLLNQFVKLESSSEMQISFCNPDFAKTYPMQNMDNLVANIQNEIQNPFWGLTGKIDQLLNIFFENHSEYSSPRAFEDEGYDSDSGKSGFLFFEHLDYKTLHKQLSDKFPDPIYLFDTLHAAQQLGIVYNVDGVFTKNGAKEAHNFNELSEGERQLVTILGLILITGKDDCLFLLDEPDTHLNPNWQRVYVNLLDSFNRNVSAGTSQSHMIVSTHSPLIVQGSEDADIFLFKRNETGNLVEVVSDDLRIRNWRIDQVLVSEYFELPSARPRSIDEFMLVRERILSKEKISQEDFNELVKYENQYGVLPTGESKEQIEAMLLFKSVATKIKLDDQDKKI